MTSMCLPKDAACCGVGRPPRAAESEDEGASSKPGYRRQNATRLTYHVIPDFNGVSPLGVIACCVATIVPAVGTLLACSDLTGYGRSVYMFIHDANMSVNTLLYNKTGGVESPLPLVLVETAYMLFFAIAAVGIFMAWLVDIHLWRDEVRCLRWIFNAFMVCLVVVGAALSADDYPSVLVMLGVALTVLATWCVRRTTTLSSHVFSFIEGILFFLIAFAFWIYWMLWAFSPLLGGYHESEHPRADEMEHDPHSPLASQDGVVFALTKGNRATTLFFLWAEPAILASIFFLIGLFMFTRGQFHVPPDDGTTLTDGLFVGRELKFALFIFFSIGGLGWVAASIAAQGMELSTMVLRICGTLFVMLSFYVVVYIGPARILDAAAEQEWIKYTIDILSSDNMKAVFLLFLWPIVPAYFFLELIHQRVRAVLVCFKVEAGQNECRALTEEARERLDHMASWDMGAVLNKSIIFGIGFFVMYSGATLGTTIFLSWLSEQIASWNLIAICAILFFVGLSLFLIPVVPGLPIYLVAGIVVVKRAVDMQMLGDENRDFFLAVAIASALCWSIKLASNVVLMKCVGEPFSDNLTVKMTVGTHTPTMRAAAIVLTAPGLTVPKVAVLIGGPDWPTAVICAMLKVPVCSNLVGTSPVFFLIVPVVLSAAYLLKAGMAREEEDPELRAMEDTYSNYSNYMMLVSTVVQMGSMVVAGMYLQAVKTDHKEELEKEREEDKPILEAIEEAEKKAKVFKEKTSWDLMPCIVKAALFFGSFSLCIMVHISLEYAVSAFRPFTLTDKISSLPEGNPINVILPAGWVAIGLLSVGILCQQIFSCWGRMKARSSEDASRSMYRTPQNSTEVAPEQEPLTGKKASDP